MKIYHQQGAKIKDSNQGVELSFGEDNIYHQLVNGYSEFDVTLIKTVVVLIMLEVTVMLMKTLDW